MSCFNEGMLRASVDGELSETQRAELEEHLRHCASCRDRFEVIAHNADRVRSALSSLAIPGESSPPDARRALARFKARTALVDGPRSVLAGPLAKRIGPVSWAIGAACLAMALLTFTPARGFAQRLMGMLRVQRITAVPLDFEALGDPSERGRIGKTIAQLLSENVVVTTKGELQEVANREEASQTAGFNVRLPASRSDAPQLKVLGEQAFHATVDRDRLQAILEEVGRSDLQLPYALDGATISARFPRIAFANYGNCERWHLEDGQDCFRLLESPSPTVTVPPELDLSELAQIGLQLGGMSAEAAREFSRSVDWASTIVVGIPQGTSYRTVQVDGVQGTLIERGGRRRGYSLLWVKDGIIYALYGSGDSAGALTVAESLH